MRSKIALLALLLIVLFAAAVRADDCSYNCTDEEKALSEKVIDGIDTGWTLNGKPVKWQRWTETDTAVEIATSLVLYMDWRQSRQIAMNQTPGRDYSETNPLLGNHPSIGKVNGIFALTVLAHPLISFLLPQPFRSAWQYSYLTVEGYCVYDNYRIGLGI